MNIYIAIIIFLLLVLVWYFLLTRKAIRIVIDANNKLFQAGNNSSHELKVLTDKYRQLAKINEVLRDINKLKVKTKK